MLVSGVGFVPGVDWRATSQRWIGRLESNEIFCCHHKYQHPIRKFFLCNYLEATWGEIRQGRIETFDVFPWICRPWSSAASRGVSHATRTWILGYWVRVLEVRPASTYCSHAQCVGTYVACISSQLGQGLEVHGPRFWSLWAQVTTLMR